MSQRELLFNEMSDDLPMQERFPINDHNRRVATPVEGDLYASSNPLIITGYTSLSMLIGFLASCRESDTPYKSIRVFLGHEPNLSPQQNFRSSRHRFSQEVTDYWLDRGVSITLCAKVLAAIELVDTGIVQTRISRDAKHVVHAKLYQADQAITMGSSNFSQFGFHSQTEANARFLQQEEPQRYSEAWQLAGYIWGLGTSYDLKNLLEQLLRKVTWQEALARACAEVLEGKWAKHCILKASANEKQLWPSQEQGIAQAMWVIENVGSVLIADATGSGKTRMAAHLMRSIADHIAKTGRRRHDLHTLICPPGVRGSWKDEFVFCGLNAVAYSSGVLSQKNAHEYDSTKTAIRRSQILAIDEAHNYFSRTSKRTQAVFESVADYVLLLTATPISRGAYDLLAVIDLLGADNLDESIVEVLKPLWRRRDELDDTMSLLQKETLQRAIQQFTIRRTKIMLNNLVAQEPERYCDRNGRQCQYPRHDIKGYLCKETKNDRAIATQIREQTKDLRGLINLQKCLRLSEAQQEGGMVQEDYLRWRLLGAKGLACHHIMASLRSSRTALLEHLSGTSYAEEQLGFKASSKLKKTGDVINRVLEKAGEPPGHELDILVPEWLTDPAAYRQACEEEAAVYGKIIALAHQLSPAREEAKAALLRELLEKHDLVLAFDHHPITLDELCCRLETCSCQVIVATGGNAAEQTHLSKALAHGSTRKKTVALCSDAMSEGRNLQAASVVVHLDMPSVVRLAEQRIGRIDRMDSEHAVIEAYWPDDAHEFKLRADERFFARHRFMADLIGANIKVPNAEIVTPKQILEELAQAKPWDGLEDAFAPLRHLVSGENRLVPKDVYEKVRHSTARVVSSVCAVKASSAWAFFAIAGTEWGAPRWIYMESVRADPEMDLGKITQHLRESLTHKTQERELDQKVADLLSQFVIHLAKTERLLLPKKKQRALDEMEHILKNYEKKARQDRERLGVVRELLACLDHRVSNSAIDLARLAERWLDIIRPVWYEHLHNRRRSEPLRLKHITPSLTSTDPLSTRDLRLVLDAVCEVKPLADRVVAAIIGVA